MAAVTPSLKKEFKVGPGRIIVARFTDVDDGDTWASGINNLGSTPFFVCGGVGNPGTQAAAGVHAEYSAGTFTFRPSSDNLGVDLVIFI